jgi:SNF2 family DNA or RNA helicase
MFVTKPVLWKCHNYQKRAVRFLVEHAAAGLILDPGMGKTSITLGALKVLQKTDPNEKMLVIAPRRPARLVWPAEAEKWEDFSHLRVEVLHGDKKEEALDRDADVYTINPEGLPWLLEGNGKRLKALIKRGVKILTVDESTKFKKTTTKRFKALKPFLPLFRRRWILTGTPAPNGLLDLFGQIYVMDLGKAFGKFITHYRSEFFYPTGFGGYTWKIQDDGEKRIFARLKGSILRMAAEDYLELPERIVNPIYVELPLEARRIYDEMEAEMVALLEGGGRLVTAATASSVSMKCAQVASGAIYLDKEPGVKVSPGQRWALVHDAKIEALLDLIDDLQGKPLLIAYEFKHDLERLVAALGKDAPVMGKSDKLDAKIEATWNRGELPYVLGHPASIGHGLNLQYGNCADVAWFTTTWDLELYKQFNDRVCRQGNKAARVRVHHIMARDTVDEVKLASLRGKDMTERRLLEALKARVPKNRKTAKVCALQGRTAGVQTSQQGATVAPSSAGTPAMMPKTQKEYEQQVIGGADQAQGVHHLRRSH